VRAVPGPAVPVGVLPSLSPTTGLEPEARTCGKLCGMVKPKHRTRKTSGYIPKLGNVVMVQGVISRLVVIGISTRNKTATVTTATLPPISYTVPWSTLTPLGEGQNGM
jgi:hypothetical protein